MNHRNRFMFNTDGYGLSSEEICNEFAAQTMFCQSQAVSD